MTKENISNTIEQKESSFGFKTQLASLLAVLSMQYGIAQTNTVNSDTTIKAKTEVVTTTNEILSPEKILEKHKISDISTATVEQLKSCYEELDDFLRGPTAKITGEARKPYIILRWKIKNRIFKIESEREIERLDEEVRISTKIVESLTWKKKE